MIAVLLGGAIAGVAYILFRERALYREPRRPGYITDQNRRRRGF